MLRVGTLTLLLAALPVAVAGADAPPSIPEILEQGFEVVTVEGDAVPLSTFLDTGRPVVVELWATWCAPCRKTMPDLVKMKEKYGDRLVVLALTIEDPEDDAAKVRRYAEAHDLNFRIAFAPDELYRAMTGRRDVAVPKLFVFDGDGALVSYIPRHSPFTSFKLKSAVARTLRR